MPTVARRTRLEMLGAVLIALVLGAVELLDDGGADIGGSSERTAVAEQSGLAAKLPAPLPASTGATRYVSPSGHDTNPGTENRPWKTIQKALNRLAPGERALVRRGTYVADLVMRRPGRARAPITVEVYPGERVVLRPASRAGDTYPIRFTDAARYIRLKGFVIERATGTSSTNVYFEGFVHHIELAGNDIRRSQDQGVFSERTTSDLHIVGNRIHDNGYRHRPEQHQSHGLYIEGQDHLIANNLVYGHRFGFGIQLYPANHDTTVVNNTVVANGHSGIVLGGSDGVYDVVVRNNIFAFNAKYGVEADSSCPTRTVVDTNVIRGNRSGDVQKAGCRSVDTARGNISADPGFVSIARGDLRIGPGSPAVDRALAAYSPRRDFGGRRRPGGAGFDIGAFERFP